MRFEKLISGSWVLRSKSCWLAAACGLMFVPTARGAFVISSDRYTNAQGNDVVVFRALNDGTGGTGTKVATAKVTEQAVGANLIFNIQDIDGDGANDVNVPGFTFAFPSSQATATQTGSFARLGSALGFTVVSTSPNAYSDTNKDGSPDTDPTPAYQNISQFTIEGSLLGQGIAANTTPVPFAVAVVPVGTPVGITGTLISGEQDATPFNFAAANGTVPEPASLGLLALGSLGLLARRRRA